MSCSHYKAVCYQNIWASCSDGLFSIHWKMLGICPENLLYVGKLKEGRTSYEKELYQWRLQSCQSWETLPILMHCISGNGCIWCFSLLCFHFYNCHWLDVDHIIESRDQVPYYPMKAFSFSTTKEISCWCICRKNYDHNFLRCWLHHPRTVHSPKGITVAGISCLVETEKLIMALHHECLYFYNNNFHHDCCHDARHWRQTMGCSRW